jgi:type II secretory pathway component PulJ
MKCCSHILIEHVDEVSRKQQEMKEVSQRITEFEAIIKFLEGKCQALELIHENQHPRNNNSSVVSKLTRHAYVVTQCSFVSCRGNHPLYRCKQFRKTISQQRFKLIRHNQLSFNCLGNSHRTSQCKVEWRCKFCSRKHNSLLPCESEPAQKNNRDCNNELQRQSTRTEKITAAKQV